MKRLLIVLLLLSGLSFAQRKPIAVGGSGAAGACTLSGAAANDVLTMTSSTACANAVPGLAISRTVSGTSATLDCSNATGDRNKVLVLSNVGAIALTGFTPGAACPDGATIFVRVSSATATVTLTPASGTCNGDSTCLFGQGFWRIRSDGSNTFVPDNLHVIDFDISASGAGTVNVPVSFACNIYEAVATGDTGDLGVDICKKAGAIPTACTTTDKISGTWAPLSAASYALDTTLSGWTKTISPNDVFDFNVGTWTNLTHAHVQIRCH